MTDERNDEEAPDVGENHARVQDLDVEVLEPLPGPLPGAPDAVRRLLGEIDVAADEITPELRAIVAGGFDSARRALWGGAVTADERNVFGWACGWTAYRRGLPSAWKEGADALRGAPEAEGSERARQRAKHTLDLLIKAAKLQGIQA